MKFWFKILWFSDSQKLEIAKDLKPLPSKIKILSFGIFRNPSLTLFIKCVILKIFFWISYRKKNFSEISYRKKNFSEISYRKKNFCQKALIVKRTFSKISYRILKFNWFTTVIVCYRIIVSYRKKNLPRLYCDLIRKCVIIKCHKCKNRMSII